MTKIFEKKMSNYPTLVSSNNNSFDLPPLRYKERDSPTIHVNEVTKKIGEQGHIQNLVEHL